MVRSIPVILALVAALSGATTAWAEGKDADFAECSRELYALFQAGGRVPKTDAVGFHGTSIEALEFARKSGGRLASSILPENADGVYFYPNLAHPAVQALFDAGTVQHGENVVPEDELDPTEDAYRGAEMYATRIAREHRFMRDLALPFDPPSQHAAHNYRMDPTDQDHRDAVIAAIVTHDEAREQALAALSKKFPTLAAEITLLREALDAHGKLVGANAPWRQRNEAKSVVTKRMKPVALAMQERIEKTFEAAQKAKGVVLFLGPKVLTEMTVTNAAPSDDGLRIDTSAGGGLPLRVLLAIEPLGDPEYEWFMAARRDGLPPVNKPKTTRKPKAD